MENANLLCVNNHYAIEYKGMKNVGSYRLHKPDTIQAFLDGSSTPLKNEKIVMKCAQNKRCTSSICEQSLCKVKIKRKENFLSYRLHKLGTPKVLWTDQQSGPITIPAFAKATQVK